MAVFKIKYMFAGDHVYCRVFVVPNVASINTTSAPLGTLRVRRREFGDMQLAMRGVYFEEDEPEHAKTVMPAPKHLLQVPRKT